jgi:hypothetical protein
MSGIGAVVPRFVGDRRNRSDAGVFRVGVETGEGRICLPLERHRSRPKVDR